MGCITCERWPLGDSSGVCPLPCSEVHSGSLDCPAGAEAPHFQDGVYHSQSMACFPSEKESGQRKKGRATL